MIDKDRYHSLINFNDVLTDAVKSVQFGYVRVFGIVIFEELIGGFLYVDKVPVVFVLYNVCAR